MNHQTSTSQHAECFDCELSSDSTAQLAKAHAASTGHTTAYTYERSTVYVGEPEPKAEKDAESTSTAESLFGAAVHRKRVALGWTADKLRAELLNSSARLDLSKTQMSRLERGERPIRLNEVLTIVYVLGMDAKEYLP